MNCLWFIVLRIPIIKENEIPEEKNSDIIQREDTIFSSYFIKKASWKQGKFSTGV
jgi:hypothetical protein